MNYAIILASGKGERIGGNTPKQFVSINGKTILEHTISAFEKNENTDRIILVVHKDFLDFCKNFKFKKLYKVVQGGLRRQDSSFIGVNLIEEDDAKVLIHDGVRPFIKNEIINNCYKALDDFDAVNIGVECSDTIIRVDVNGIIKNIPKRSSLLRCQTPQGFRVSVIKKAHKIAQQKNLEVTDDTGLIVGLGLCDVKAIEGDLANIKVTYKDDLEFAQKTLF